MRPWRQLVPAPVRERLSPLALRARTRVAGPLLRRVDTAALLEVLFPTTPSDEVYQALRADFPEHITSPAQVREILLQVEQCFFPTPFLVRFAQSDLVETQVEGMPFLLDSADRSVSLTLERARSYEPHMTAVFRRFVEPGMTVLDVGANIGYFTVLASTLVGQDGRVLAFEPSSENCRLLLANAERNGVENLSLFPVALAAERGWSYLSANVGSNGALRAADFSTIAIGQGAVVPTFPLDDLVDGPVHFVKLDIEGAEGLAVSGAMRTLQTHRPVVTTELSKEMLRRVSGMEPDELLAPFEALGYRIHLVDKTSGELHERAGVVELLAEWADDVRIEDLLLLPTA